MTEWELVFEARIDRAVGDEIETLYSATGTTGEDAFENLKYAIIGAARQAEKAMELYRKQEKEPQ